MASHCENNFATITIITWLCFALGVWSFGIGCASWLVHLQRTQTWHTEFAKTQDVTPILSDLYRSWNQHPFVDAIVTAARECPDSHPEDLVYDMWPGTRGHCDCLQSEMLRSYYLDMYCDRDSESGIHGSEDCHERHGLAPIIQNKFRGLRYCGRRSAMSFKEMQRPVISPENGKLVCPQGYLPCNPDFHTEKDGKDYAICHKLGERFQTCPITDLKFMLDENNDVKATYMEKKGDGDAKDVSIYISFDFMRHGIEHITIAPKSPC